MKYPQYALSFLMLLPFTQVFSGQARAAPLSLLIPLEPSTPVPDSGTKGGYLFNLRPLGAPLGRMLEQNGIYLIAKDLSEQIGNVSGGVRKGSIFQGYTLIGADFDLEKIMGFKGASIQLKINDLQGQSFAKYTGSAYLNNRIFAGNGPALRLNEISYPQRLFHDHATLRMGRLPAYTQFDGSELYCTFLTSLCRTPAGYTFNHGYPPYLASSWAAVAQVKLSGAFYLNAGVYENEPIMAYTNHGGFPGSDWRISQSSGATTPLQLGYRTTLKNDRYPRAFSVGGFYNSGKYADPLLNTAGLNRAIHGGLAKQDISSSEVWVQAQQMVYRPDETDRGMTLFAGGNWATSGEPNIQRMIFGGVYYKGLFASRPNDTAGFAVSMVGLNPRLASYETSLLQRDGGGQTSRTEVSYQFNYGIAVAPGLMIKPFGEYISHPDQVGITAPTHGISHAFSVGTLFEVDFATLLGLPGFPE